MERAIPSAPKRLVESESFCQAGVYALVFVGSMAVMIALVFLIVDQSFKTALLRASDDDLRAIKTAYATAQPGRGLHEATEMIEDRTVASDIENRFLLQQGLDMKVAGNMRAMPPVEGIQYVRDPNRDAQPESEHRVLGRGEFIAPGIFAFVGRDLFEVNQSENEILLTFAGVLAMSVVLAGACGLWLSGRYLRRIDAISETCSAIMTGRLHDRVSIVGASGELKRLALTINRMLDRIQSLMESLKQVSTDIAHDLRTPLAHMRYSLESAVAKASSPEEFGRAAQQAVAEADLLLEMFAALLRIARIEAGDRREAFQSFDLRDALCHAFAMYRPQLEDTCHSARLSTSSSATVYGDRQLVLQLIANLFDNVIRHTPAGTKVTAWTGEERGAPVLYVADDGPGIPKADRQRVLHRFVRLEQSRTSPGHGLGLSMVAAIVEVHDGHIELLDNAPGLCVRVQFQAAH